MTILTPKLLLDKYKNLHQARKYLSIANKRWKIIRISNWIYITKEYKYEELCTVANMLVQNSYISLHTVIWNEWIFTEIVNSNTITSITTTRKPRKYKIKIDNLKTITFSYNNISKDLFWLPKSFNPLFSTYLVATKEKALIDFLHLNTQKRKFKDDEDIKEWLKSLRLKLDDFNWDLFMDYIDEIKKLNSHYNKLKRILIILFQERRYIDFFEN